MIREENPRPDSSNDYVGSTDPVVAFEEVDSDQIPSTDIVFECPYCGKSLSIDQRGAGLVIECTACQQLVTVPIPEGMKITDIDLPPEEQEAQLSSMRVLLSQSQERIAKLSAENQELSARVTSFEKTDALHRRQLEALRAKVSTLSKAQEELAEALVLVRRSLEEL